MKKVPNYKCMDCSHYKEEIGCVLGDLESCRYSSKSGHDEHKDKVVKVLAMIIIVLILILFI